MEDAGSSCASEFLILVVKRDNMNNSKCGHTSKHGKMYTEWHENKHRKSSLFI